MDAIKYSQGHEVPVWGNPQDYQEVFDSIEENLVTSAGNFSPDEIRAFAKLDNAAYNAVIAQLVPVENIPEDVKNILRNDTRAIRRDFTSYDKRWEGFGNWDDCAECAYGTSTLCAAEIIKRRR